MEALVTLGRTLGFSFAAGINLYATVAILGLAERYGWVRLPEQFAVFDNDLVIGAAIVLFVVEFVADKVPVVDSVWDALHTFIRPPAAALMTWSAFADLSDTWKVSAALLAGGVALSAHGAKASARAAVNTTPEPFTNWLLSLGEDAVAVTLTWMALQHPIFTAALVAILVVLAIVVVVKLFRFGRGAWRRLTSPVSARPPEIPRPAA